MHEGMEEGGIFSSLSRYGNVLLGVHCLHNTIRHLSTHNPALLDGVALVDDRLCRKDTGREKRLRKWSHGDQFSVRGGGHIDTWQPLYRYMCDICIS